MTAVTFTVFIVNMCQVLSMFAVAAAKQAAARVSTATARI